MAEKNLPATGRRITEARSKGQVARSTDLDAVVLLGGGLACLLIAGPRLGGGFGEVMQRCLGSIGALGGGAEASIPSLGQLVGADLLAVFCLVAGVSMLAITGVQLAQVGVGFSDKALEWDVERFNPISGVQRLFNVRKLVLIGTSLLKLVLISVLTWMAVKSLLDAPVFARPVAPDELGAFLVSAAWEVGWRVLLALAVIAAIDFLYQRFQHLRDLRMSHDEVKEEHKMHEGSPEVKHRLRALGRKLLLKSFRRQLEDMADATIVITNPTHFAVALRYVRGVTPAPVVVAKGQDRNALRLRERAAELGVNVIENKPLARGLYKHAKVGATIPTLYYQAVAGVLAELYRRGLRPRTQ